MNIITIDPGNVSSGYAIERNGKLVEYGKIKNNELEQIIKENKFDVAAIEMIVSYGMSIGKTTIDTIYFIGKFSNILENNNCKVYLISRPNIKLNVCLNSLSKDKNVRQAVIEYYGGFEVAIGGIKCKVCKGKGWFKKRTNICELCNGKGYEYEKGPLYNARADMWSAIAIIIAYHRIINEQRYENFYQIELLETKNVVYKRTKI